MKLARPRWVSGRVISGAATVAWVAAARCAVGRALTGVAGADAADGASGAGCADSDVGSDSASSAHSASGGRVRYVIEFLLMAFPEPEPRA
ncbi:MAG: hypothetical protein Tsb0020_55130 [Haliangiales bacterium]